MALLSQTPNVSSARMYTVGRTLQVGERPGRRAKLAAPGKGQGALGHLFTKDRLDPCREAASDHHIQRRQDAEKGNQRNLATKGNRRVHGHIHVHMHSHTGAPTRVHTHSQRALTHMHPRVCSCTHLHAHTHIHAHGALIYTECTRTHSHIHTGCNLEKLAPVVEVQTSQSYMSPRCISLGSHITSQSPTLRAPQPAPGVLHNLRSWVSLDKANVASRL